MPNGTIAASGAISISTFRGATQGVIAPTYSLTRSVGSVNEGGSFTISFSTNQPGSFGYTISGVNSADIGGASLTGTVSNGSVLSYSVTADSTTENTETFNISLNNGLASTSVTINDTSTAPTPTYTLTRSVASVNEGGSFTISFSTNQAGSFAYSISGVSSADIGGASLSGSISNGSVLSYSVTADATTEGAESFNISLNNGQASTSVTINDTSTTPAPVPPSSATWSVGYSNNGTAGPISVFVLVTLNRAATVTTTYTFSGVVVQNGVTFTVPSVTIPVGSTSANPSSFSGVTNGSGPYSTITLRVTPVTVPYPLTPSGAINTSFQYSA